jgi:IclR family pca regulon transcriptional regulator
MGTGTIQAISRAVQILEMFSVQQLELSLAQLSERFGLGKTTTHRYATSLRENGLLRFDRRSGRYALGIRLVQLGQIAQAGLSVVQAAGPYLERTANELNETVVLSIWDGESAVVVRIAEAPRRTTYLGVRVGAKLSPRAAQARIFRAHSDPRARRNPDLARILASGVAVATLPKDETRAVACPIYQGGEVVAAMAVVGTPRRIPNRPDSAIVQYLRAVAAKLSADLGSAATGEPAGQAPGPGWQLAYGLIGRIP